jgi:hypothetical protein
MAENHRRRIAHFGGGSVFIAILRVVVGAETVTEGVMRPTVNDGSADERPISDAVELSRLRASE